MKGSRFEAAFTGAVALGLRQGEILGLQLPAACSSALAKQKEIQDGQRSWAGTSWRETGYVFTSSIGTPIDARDLLREYYRITRPKPKKPGEQPPKLAFPPIRFHDLRHYAGFRTIPGEWVSKLLGSTFVRIFPA